MCSGHLRKTMELRQYWNVIWKRKWLVLAIIAIATIASAGLALTSKKTFDTQVLFITRQQPTPDLNDQMGIAGTPQNMIFTFDRYYNWFGSEFLVDDYTLIATSDAFAGSVLQTMREKNFTNEEIQDWNDQLTANAKPDTKPVLIGEEARQKLEDNIKKLTLPDLKQGLTSDRKNRELRINVVASDDILAKAIADASGIVLADAKLKPIRGTLVDDKGVFTQIDQVGPGDINSSRSKDIINAVIRIIIGVAAALALAFLLEYLDTTVRDARDANKILDLPVLGAIPKA